MEKFTQKWLTATVSDALLRHRVGYLAASANDEAIQTVVGEANAVVKRLIAEDLFVPAPSDDDRNLPHEGSE